MTLRALIIAIVCVLFISGFGYINDCILNLESFSNGHLLPIVVIGALLLTVMLLNPLLHRMSPRLPLRPAELALIVVLAGAASGIPGRALMEHFAQNVVMPHHWYSISPGWQTRHMLDYFPKDSLVVNDNPDLVVNRFHIGSDKSLTPPDSTAEWLRREFGLVPWRSWLPALRTWLPLIMLTVVAMASLSLVVHKQWADHEHLQYPLASFTAALIDQEPGHAFNALLRSKLFWTGFIMVFLMRLDNGLYAWFPEEIIPVKTYHSLGAFYNVIPSMRRNPWAYGLMKLEIFPLVTAFGFLLSAEISFTLGVSQILWAIFCCTVVGYGFDLSTDYDIGGWQGWNRTGAYIALTLMILYTGRFYYLNLLRRAFFLPSRRGMESVDRPGPGAVTAMRLFLISTVALCLLAVRLGLTWPVAILTILLMLVSFFGVARLSAETGLFFIQPGWLPFGSIMALFGGYAIGPTAIVTSAFLCSILCMDQSQCLMAYLTNGLKLADTTKGSTTRMTTASALTYALGILVALVVVIIACYDFGTPKNSWWSYYRTPTLPFRAADPTVLQLSATNQLAQSEALSGWERICSIRPVDGFLWAFGMGFVGVLVFAVLRLRTRWWPLHPCMFLIWASFPLCVFSNALLGGWLLKKLVLKFGGNRMVQQLKPLCFGVISADIAGALVFMIAGAIYYLITGEMPKTYRFFPR